MPPGRVNPQDSIVIPGLNHAVEVLQFSSGGGEHEGIMRPGIGGVHRFGNCCLLGPPIFHEFQNAIN